MNKAAMATDETLAVELEKSRNLLAFDAASRKALQTIAAPVKEALPKALKATHATAADFADVQSMFATPELREAVYNSHLQRWTRVLEGDHESLLGVALTGANANAKTGVNPKYHILTLGRCLGETVATVIKETIKPRGFLKSGAQDADRVADAVDAAIRSTFIDIGLLMELYARRTERAQAEALQEREQEMERLGGLFASALETIAARDLRHRITDELPGVFAKMRDDFNNAIEQLAETIAEIDRSADRIREGSAGISESTREMAQRSEQQAASIEETAAALEEITATVNQSAHRADDAGRLVKDTKESAERSGTVVRRAVDAMGEIERSSDEISNIIGVIDDIAFQTNLLALNAGVEAARAGEAGKGFAVVAQEVRELAQRSASAAREIKALITKSSEQVKSGVELVGETGKALEVIVAQVNEINVNVSAIVDGAKEQAAGLKEINQAINVMDQGTQQNAAKVAQTDAASQALNGEIDGIVAMLNQFRTGKRGKYAAQQKQAAAAGTQPLKPAPAKAAPALREAKPGDARPNLMPAPTRQQNLLASAFKARAETANAGWEEF